MESKYNNENKENLPVKMKRPLQMAATNKGPLNDVGCKTSVENKELLSRLPLNELNAASGSNYVPIGCDNMYSTTRNSMLNAQDTRYKQWNVKEFKECGKEERKVTQAPAVVVVRSGVQNICQYQNWLTQVHMTYMHEYTWDVFRHLFSSEKKLLSPLADVRSAARGSVVNWLIELNGRYGNPAVIQLAGWYLDSFLGTEQISIENLQLVATACYWLAQKQEGRRSAPQMSARLLTTAASNTFTVDQLIAMEIHVLKTLKFPPKPVIPQEFISFLSWWCDNKFPEEIEVAATFMCLSGILLNKTMYNEYPSVIAAACVRNALLLLRKDHLVAHFRTCPVYQHAKTKAANMAYTMSILRKSTREAAKYPIYRAPYHLYSQPPYYTAQKIVAAAVRYALMGLAGLN